MSNIAFTTLVILLFATPGYIARSAYFSNSFSNEVLPRNLMDDIARAVFYSLPFHAVGIGILHHFQYLVAGVDIDFTILFRLLSGDYGEDSAQVSSITQNIYTNLHKIGAYFTIIAILAFFAGRYLRHLVWKQEWDVKFPAVFGYRNKWVYTLFGRGKHGKGESKVLFSYLDALVELGKENTRLYRGVIYEFTTDESGTLRDIVLIEALRGKFKAEIAGEEVNPAKSGFYWEQIPGDFFILKYQEIKNMNITYVRTSSAESAQLDATADPPEVTDQAYAHSSISQ